MFRRVRKEFAEEEDRHGSPALYNRGKLKRTSFKYDVEDHSVIGRIRLMTMLEPFCNTAMNLDITDKQRLSDSDVRVAKIGTTVVVSGPGNKDLHGDPL
jgi:hypothetical protein